jgi:hypothetical protein
MGDGWVKIVEIKKRKEKLYWKLKMGTCTERIRQKYIIILSILIS